MAVENYRIITMNMPGNVHQGAAYVNDNGLGEYLLQFVGYPSGACIGVFRMPRDVEERFKKRGVL